MARCLCHGLPTGVDMRRIFTVTPYRTRWPLALWSVAALVLLAACCAAQDDVLGDDDVDDDDLTLILNCVSGPALIATPN